MVRVKGFKQYVLLAVSVVLISLAVAGCFLWLFVNEKRKTGHIRQSLTAARQEIRALVDEKDMLMARLVALEVDAGDAGPPDIEVNETPLGYDDPVPATADAVRWNEPDEGASPTLVTVNDFSIIQDMDSNRVKIEFTVEKIDDSLEYVSGRMFVVLEDADTENGRMMTVPAVYLKDGRPTQISRGQYFSISRFKPVSMSARIDHPEEFTDATVFIYTPEGELFFEDSFAVNPIQYRQIPSAAADAADTRDESEAPDHTEPTIQ